MGGLLSIECKVQFYKMKRDMGRDGDSGCNTILFNTTELLKSN